MDDQTSETTQLLRAWADGDRGALKRLTPHVYRTLRHILVDRARRRVTAKRGGNAERVDFDELPDIGGGRARESLRCAVRRESDAFL